MTTIRPYSSFISKCVRLRKNNMNMCTSATRTTVDAREVDFHSGIKDDWWNKNGPMRPLHAMNELRVPLVREGLLETIPRIRPQTDTPRPLKGAKVLDVGCGGGILSEALAKLGAEVVGLDASSDLISIAQNRIVHDDKLDLKYINDVIEEFCKDHREEFDGAVASEVLEHVVDKDLFVESCLKTLKPGGSFFITTLNKTNLSWLFGIVAAENFLKIVPRGTHEWEKFISPEDTCRILEKYNCKTKLVHGMLYNVIKNQWSWSNNTAINYAIQSIKKMHPE